MDVRVRMTILDFHRKKSKLLDTRLTIEFKIGRLRAHHDRISSDMADAGVPDICSSLAACWRSMRLFVALTSSSCHQLAASIACSFGWIPSARASLAFARLSFLC